MKCLKKSESYGVAHWRLDIGKFNFTWSSLAIWGWSLNWRGILVREDGLAFRTLSLAAGRLYARCYWGDGVASRQISCSPTRS